MAEGMTRWLTLEYGSDDSSKARDGALEWEMSPPSPLGRREVVLCGFKFPPLFSEHHIGNRYVMYG